MLLYSEVHNTGMQDFILLIIFLFIFKVLLKDGPKMIK